MGNFSIILSTILTAVPAVAAALIDAWQSGKFTGLHGVALLSAIGAIILGVVLQSNHNSTVSKVTSVANQQALNSENNSVVKK